MTVEEKAKAYDVLIATLEERTTEEIQRGTVEIVDIFHIIDSAYGTGSTVIAGTSLLEALNRLNSRLPAKVK